MTRLLVVMGSGETSPTMIKTHRSLFERLGPAPVPAVLLDTPVGFQENAEIIATKAVEYFRESVGRDVDVASWRRAAPDADPVEYETMLARVRSARYVFAGPGSPSYALKQWSGSQVPLALAEKLRSGGCVTFASAAAVTLGRFAVPVYEIYKVGEDPRWLDGLNLIAEAGLDAVVIPHFDNAEGGNHDTRFCYLGERRLALMEQQLPPSTFILGVDEHTACVIDLDAGTATVEGRGVITVRRAGQIATVAGGSTVALADLRELAEKGGVRREAAAPVAAPARPVPDARRGVRCWRRSTGSSVPSTTRSPAAMPRGGARGPRARTDARSTGRATHCSPTSSTAGDLRSGRWSFGWASSPRRAPPTRAKRCAPSSRACSRAATRHADRPALGRGRRHPRPPRGRGNRGARRTRRHLVGARVPSGPPPVPPPSGPSRGPEGALLS